MIVQQYGITPEELTGVGVIGLADTPGLSVAQMQAKLEETARAVVIPHLNAALEATEAALTERPTAERVQQMLTEQLVAVGAGDMAAALYDPTAQQRDVFAAGGPEQAGMVRLSDTPDADATQQQGTAATPAAVQAVRLEAQTAQQTAEAAGRTALAAQETAQAAVPKTGATMTGNLIGYGTNRSTSGGCMRNAVIVSSGSSPAANLVSTNSLIFSRA